MKAPKVGIEGRRQDPAGKAQKEGVRTSVFTNMRCSPNDYLLLTRTRWGVQTHIPQMWVEFFYQL
ncbi:hypothetical protein QUA32_11890 [Microcoleus sp. Pol14D6]|uniref:hypothetical protein n=1 Tax=unclassified Microcoleus TaxID=2642155 RepID=UPI002FCF39A4